MKAALLQLLRCPKCKAPVQAQPLLVGQPGDEIEEGVVRCANKHAYPVTGGIPRMLPDAFALCAEFSATHRKALLDLGVAESSLAGSETTTSSQMRRSRKQFEIQWAAWGEEEKLYGRTQEDMDAMVRGGYVAPGVLADFFPGKRVLDAGCGHGAFVRSFAQAGAETVGLDYGTGVDLARKRCAGLPQVHFVQGDIRCLPFARGSFDLAFCHGALPFLPDPREGFDELCASVKEGGLVRLWLYPKSGVLWEGVQGTLRAITKRLPPKLLYALCYVPVPLLSFTRTYSNTSLRNSTWRQCAQVIWDYYSPPLQWHHTESQIRGWYAENGFDDVRVLDIPLSTVGRRGFGP